GRVGALPAACLEPTAFAAAVQDRVEQAPFGRAGDQTGAELAPDGAVEAGVGPFQGEGVLPVDAGADGGGGLAVGQVLDELEDGDEGEPPGGLGRSAPRGVEVGEVG